MLRVLLVLLASATALSAAPLWSGNKRLVLNSMAKYFKENQIYQGKEFYK